jgi:hypothetical protein
MSKMDSKMDSRMQAKVARFRGSFMRRLSDSVDNDGTDPDDNQIDSADSTKFTHTKFNTAVTSTVNSTVNSTPSLSAGPKTGSKTGSKPAGAGVHSVHSASFGQPDSSESGPIGGSVSGGPYVHNNVPANASVIVSGVQPTSSDFPSELKTSVSSIPGNRVQVVRKNSRVISEAESDVTVDRHRDVNHVNGTVEEAKRVKQQLREDSEVAEQLRRQQIEEEEYKRAEEEYKNAEKQLRKEMKQEAKQDIMMRDAHDHQDEYRNYKREHQAYTKAFTKTRRAMMVK